MLLKHTDMDVRFSSPVIMDRYWRWWEKRLLPNVVHRYESLDELFELKPKSGHWGGRIHSIGMKAKSFKVRDDYMESMYKAVTVNLSHIASYLILRLHQLGLKQLGCPRFHKMLYVCIKLLQKTDFHLHRSLCNPAEYGAIASQGSTRLNQFLGTMKSMGLVHVDNGEYVLDDKLIKDFSIDEIRTENLISVYANEIAPLSAITKLINSAIDNIDKVDAICFAEYRFDDQLLAFNWDKKEFSKPSHLEINQQQTATEDPDWFFLKSSEADASAVLLIHGFLASPAEMRSLGERLHSEGHHVLGVRLKGHGTSPWDLRSRDWSDWLASVTRGFNIIKAYSRSIHIVGFSTGGLLALLQAANHPHKKISSVTSISAPIDFINKNLKFIPLLHHANRIIRWVSSEGLMPFRPNQPEHPEVNYQHIPVRALYQLQLLVEHIMAHPLQIGARVNLYQSDQDPVVEPSSVDKLYNLVKADDKNKFLIHADRHGVVYENIDQIQQKICASLLD